MAYEIRRGNGRRRHHPVLITILILLLVTIAVYGVSGFMVLRSVPTVKENARTAVAQISDMTDQIKAGDTEGASKTAQSIVTLADDVNRQTDSPAWVIASTVPVLGSDIRSARTLADVLDDLSTQALEPMVDQLAGAQLSNMVGADGSINIEMLQGFLDSLTTASAAVQTATDTVNALPAAHVGQVQEKIDQAKDGLNSVNDRLAAVDGLAEQLPTMLGANGDRHYLIIAQGNSEARSTGGFPGARGLLTVTNGQLNFGTFGKAGGWTDTNITGATDEEINIGVNLMYGLRPDNIPGDINGVPDFPRAATMMINAWTAQGGQDVDGVVAVDPVFLQSMLAITGSVTLSNGQVLDGSNTAQYLLHDIYQNYATDDEQNAIFGEASQLAIKTIFGGIGNAGLGNFVSTLRGQIEGGRFFLYFKNADEQVVAQKMHADGAMPTDPATPQIGVYVNSRTSAKDSWYLNMQTVVGEAVTNADGTISYTVTTTLQDVANVDELVNNTDYIKGPDPESRGYGMYNGVLLTAPAGGTISNVSADGEWPVGLTEASLYGFDVWAGTALTHPQETTTITYTVTCAAGSAAPTVWQTPNCGRTF